MYFPAIISLLAAVASAAVVSSPETAAVPAIVAPRTNQCPAGYDYCGWFDKVQNLPPRCVKHISRPKVMKKPTCSRGQVAYCSTSPGNFVPYDASHEYCLDTGYGRCDCFDVHATIGTIQHILGDLFCVIDKAFTLLGLDCLLYGKCRPKWQVLDLGCTVEELLWFVQHAVCKVVDLVHDILGGLLGGLFGRSA